MLVIAVIGGLYRLEGAFVGALAYVFINDHLQTISFDRRRASTRSIGLIFLAIVLVSPAGLLGIWERALGMLRRREPEGGGTSPLSPTAGQRRLVRRIRVSARVETARVHRGPTDTQKEKRR